MNNVSQLISQTAFNNYISSTYKKSNKLKIKLERWAGNKLFYLSHSDRLAAYLIASMCMSLILGIIFRYLISTIYKPRTDWLWTEWILFLILSYKMGTFVYPIVTNYMDTLVERRYENIIEEKEKDKIIIIKEKDLNELMNQIFSVKEKLTDKEYKNLVELLSDANKNKQEKTD